MNTYTFIEGERSWTVYTIDPLPHWVTFAQLQRLASSPGRCQWWWATQCGGAGGAYEEAKAVGNAKHHRTNNLVTIATGRFDRRSFQVSSAIYHWNRRGVFLDTDRKLLAEAAFIFWSEQQQCWRPSEMGTREGLMPGTSLAGGIVQ